MPRPAPSKQQRHLAKLIAIIVRNAMEDFHCKHLTDKQMRELNPIIRNAICTALHALEHADTVQRAAAWLDYHGSMIPDYWEKPELLEGYKQTWDDGM